MIDYGDIYECPDCGNRIAITGPGEPVGGECLQHNNPVRMKRLGGAFEVYDES